MNSFMLKNLLIKLFRKKRFYAWWKALTSLFWSMYCLLKKIRYEGTARYPETPKPGKKKRSQKHKRKVKNPYMKFKEKQRRHGESPMPKVVSLSPSPKPQIVTKSLSPKFDQPQVVSLSPKLPVYYENWYDKKIEKKYLSI